MTAEAEPVKPTASAGRSPGAALAAERERQGLSRADMAQRLHISVSQIEALENSDFSRFPRGPFLRGFTRNYARALGLDAERLVERVAESAPQTDAPGIVVPSQNIRFDPSGQHLASPYVKAALVVFVLAVLGFAGTYWWLFVRPVAVSVTPAKAPDTVQAPATSSLPPSSGEEAAKPAANVADAEARPRNEPAEAQPAEAKVAVPARSGGVAGETKTVAPAASAAPAPAASAPEANATVARAGESTLRFTFRAAAWVQVFDASGQSLVARNHPAGSTGEVYGKPPFRVTIGNAPGVSLSYNGRDVDLAPHTRENVARFTLP